MKLSKLLERLEYKVVQGNDEIEVTTLINDSRKLCLTDTGSSRMWRAKEQRLL